MKKLISITILLVIDTFKAVNLAELTPATQLTHIWISHTP